jgi:iron(III) transport system ATP-binding protein
MDVDPVNTEVALDIRDLVVRYGDVEAVRGATITAKIGEHVTLVGPSGCGKTTTLRAIAGLEAAVAGSINLFGRPVYDANKRINLPPEQREVSMVFQSYAIWPHMSVFDNVAYGLKIRRVPAPEIAHRVMQALELVGLSNLAQRQAPQLSGGQQQRVALARAFVFDPKLLLFDEPLSNLDAKMRAQMRVELKDLTQRLGITSIYVTHDQEEALSMSDKVVIMNGGIVQQQSDPLAAYYRPINAFVADFMGQSNVLPVASVAGGVNGHTIVKLPNGSTLASAWAADPSGIAAVAIKTAHLRPARAAIETDNPIPARVTRRMFVGDLVEYTLDWEGIELRARALSSELLDVGEQVFCNVAADHVVPLNG